MAKVSKKTIPVRATKKAFWGPQKGFERLYTPGEEFNVASNQFKKSWMEKINSKPKPKAKRKPKAKAKAKPRPKTGST
jgi:hypothetical protein